MENVTEPSPEAVQTGTSAPRPTPPSSPLALHPENRVSGRILCRACQVPMSRGMLAWHLRNGHAFLTCKICSARVLATGYVLVSGHTGDFCSRACREECLRRGLCFNCFKTPDGTFRNGACLSCRSAYRKRMIALHQGLKSVSQATEGMRDAAQLPPPYYRANHRDSHGH
jgi:hypothetical protein